MRITMLADNNICRYYNMVDDKRLVYYTMSIDGTLLVDNRRLVLAGNQYWPADDTMLESDKI